MCTLAINSQYNGIELSFSEKPSEKIRADLKDLGFRWHSVKKVWYAKNTADRMTLAKELSGAGSETVAPVAQANGPEVASRYGVKVGDILSASWGYNMTIVEYYKVTKVISATKLELVELGHILTDSDRGGGEYLLPDTEHYIGEPIIKQITQSGYEKRTGDWHVKINSSVSLSPWSGRAMYQNTWD